MVVEDAVREYFKDAPIMVEIARCESHFRQYDRQGNVLKNPTSSAIGIFQIMSSIHKDTASYKGMDIRSADGNLEYARYLFEREGTRPWLSSSQCWGAHNHIARN